MANPELFFGSFEAYAIAFVVTFYFVCSVAVSIVIGLSPPEIPNPVVVKDNVTIRVMIVATVLAAIPYCNILLAFAGVFMLIMNCFIWLFNSSLKPNKFLDKKPFNKQ